MKDFRGKQIKLGQTIRHFSNGEWRTERVGWAYDSIAERRHWVYKPSGLSIKYSTARHNLGMALADGSPEVLYVSKVS